MKGQPPGHASTALLRDIALFAALVALGFLFFLPVRNNGFWHQQDFIYLMAALEAAESPSALFSMATGTFQPIVNLIFLAEFNAFGLAAWHYYSFNIIVHSLNAFLVYILLRTLLKDVHIGLLSSLLFLFAVGNYGKAVMVASGISDLVITMLTLLTMIFYVRNELDDDGRLGTSNFTLCLFFFCLCLLSKATSFSLLGIMLAFNVFFRERTKRRILDRNIIVFGSVALVVLIAKFMMLEEIPGASDLAVFSWSFPRNFGSYLVRMVFPIQYSTLVVDSGPLVRFVYRMATEIRVVIFLCILSYSVFGFIFGNRVIRFFIAWTYITVAPFCFFRFPADWLNIRYLYLVSVGFSMILASGTVLASRLLYQKAWRRFLPLVIPIFFVFLSRFVVGHLDGSYEQKEKRQDLDTAKQALQEAFDNRK